MALSEYDQVLLEETGLSWNPKTQSHLNPEQMTEILVLVLFESIINSQWLF